LDIEDLIFLVIPNLSQQNIQMQKNGFCIISGS